MRTLFVSSRPAPDLVRNLRGLGLCSAALLLASLANASTIIYSSFPSGGTSYDTGGWSIGGTEGWTQGLKITPAETGVVQTIEIVAQWAAGGAALDVSLWTDSPFYYVRVGPDSLLETVRVCCFPPDSRASIALANSVLHPLLKFGKNYWVVVSPIAPGDEFGWDRNIDPPWAPNVQRPVGSPWYLDLADYRGFVRILGDEPTPARTTTWGRLKSLYR